MRITKHFTAVLSAVLLMVMHCQRHTTEPLPATISGKVFFTGLTSVKQHHGIQVIAYLRSDTVLTPVDTTYTDTTGFYSFGKPSVDGVYILTAYYRLYYPDTVTVKFQAGRREGEVIDMHIQQLSRIKLSSDKGVYRLSDSFTWTVQVINIFNIGVLLPDMNWFGCERWNELIFVLKTKSESKFIYSISGFPCHPPACSGLAPGATITLTRSLPISLFTDKNGNKIGPGRYFFYASNQICLPLEWNRRIMPVFEPTEVEIVP